ncbi:MAG: 30S ribosomal protein S6 [Leptolyngbyaceae bacterium]|nr:30S ribosomal protein S6 [Leptolyngbyaceae bacterium]
MNSYETMYILRPDLGEDLTEKSIEKYQSLLREQGAVDLETQHRGKRRLAYDIDNYREGVYVQMNYQAPGEAIALLQRAMKLSDEVIRYLTICPETKAAAVPAASAE